MYNDMTENYLQKRGTLWTIDPSEYRLFGLSGLRTIDPSDYRPFGLSTFRTIETSNYWAVGLSGCHPTYKYDKIQKFCYRKTKRKIFVLQHQLSLISD